MKATLDQFGRVLIPKKIRQKLGLAAGDSLVISIDETSGDLFFHPETKNSPTVTLSECGFPVLSFAQKETIDFDVVELIKTGREERSKRLIGDISTHSSRSANPALLNEPPPTYQRKED